MKMAIVHDLAECIVGDITPFCGVSKEEKYRREEVRFPLLFIEQLLTWFVIYPNGHNFIQQLWLTRFKTNLIPCFSDLACAVIF